MKIYHATTERKARMYRETSYIKSPVRGFSTLMAAMAWAIKVKRTVIYEIESDKCHKLPDHHNAYGDAWWADENIHKFTCVFSAKSDA